LIVQLFAEEQKKTDFLTIIDFTFVYVCELVTCVIGFWFPMYWRYHQTKHHLTERDLDEIDARVRRESLDMTRKLTTGIIDNNHNNDDNNDTNNDDDKVYDDKPKRMDSKDRPSIEGLRRE
jgi:hypothetical protein